MKKSASEWLLEKEYHKYTILDPDGWDRKNFKISWDELITKEEFEHRLFQSTIMVKDITNAT